MSSRIFFQLVVWLLFSSNLFSQINYPDKNRLNSNWEFYKGDLGSCWEALRPVKNADDPEAMPIWEQVSLPHCFNATDAVDPYVNYYQGIGWYRTQININNPYDDGRVLLHFEGAGQKTKVFVDTIEVGSHIGGYDEWIVDITETINKLSDKEKATLIIRCDNSRDTEMIPSDLSDFNLYGGIYRYLNLVYVPSLSINKLRIDPILDLKKKVGSLTMYADFENHSKVDAAELCIEIFSPTGELIQTDKKNIVDFNKQTVFTAKIMKPEYWSPESPKLYSCKLTLTSQAGSISYEEKFGFRHFEFIKQGPFLINGKRLLLRGTHRHEDHAGVGAAMTEEMIIREMELIKEMGVNFIRLGHYQQSRIVLEQCDRLGLLVWEEIPWCRGGLGGEQYKEQAHRMLRNMIVSHRNHPSIILWGLGNENDWPGDFSYFDQEAIRTFMKELNDLSHMLDSSRKTCIRRCDFCKDIVDVYSPSIWAGWYRGVYTDYKRVSYNEMKQVNHFLHVEWGGDNHAGRHAENPYIGLDQIKTKGEADERTGDASLYGGSARASKDGDWSESYSCDLIDWHLKEQETMPWLTGTAYWPFKDFSTPIRPENPIPYVNQKGVVQRDLTPKEAFYVFQSYWTDKPMIHIYGHSWPVRWGEENELKLLKVYSNCERVELFLNGNSLGIKKRNTQDFPASGLRWETRFPKGENNVVCVGYKGKTKVTDTIAFHYQTDKWNSPTQLTIAVVKENKDEALIEVQLRDENNILCLDAANFVEFESIGAGTLKTNQGTIHGSKKIQVANGRAFITLQKGEGKTIVACKSNRIETVFLTL